MAISELGADSLEYDPKSSAPSGTEGDTYYNSTTKKIQLRDDVGFDDVGAAAFVITAKTSNYSILAADCTGSYGFSNDGAAGTITFTLPTAVAGYKVDIYNAEDQAILIGAGAADTLKVDGMSAASTLISAVKGDNITLYCINATEWLAITKGNWAGQFYGFCAGGTSGGPKIITIDYIDLTATTGNAGDKGDLSVARNYFAGCKGINYGFFCGGSDGLSNDIIDYIDITTTTGDATDTGNLTVGRSGVGCVAGTNYGFIGGGGSTDVIDYIDISVTSGNAVDTGDLPAARNHITGVSGNTYGYLAGGDFGGRQNNIYSLALNSISQNAIDTGDLTVSRYGTGGCNGSTYGFWGSGADTANTIDYINMDVAIINAVDRGDLSVARYYLAGSPHAAGAIYGFFMGGYKPPAGEAYYDIIDYIDINIAIGNAADRGNLTATKMGVGGI